MSESMLLLIFVYYEDDRLFLTSVQALFVIVVDSLYEAAVLGRDFPIDECDQVSFIYFLKPEKYVLSSTIPLKEQGRHLVISIRA